MCYVESFNPTNLNIIESGKRLIMLLWSWKSNYEHHFPSFHRVGAGFLSAVHAGSGWLQTLDFAVWWDSTVLCIEVFIFAFSILYRIKYFFVVVKRHVYIEFYRTFVNISYCLSLLFEYKFGLWIVKKNIYMNLLSLDMWIL